MFLAAGIDMGLHSFIPIAGIEETIPSKVRRHGYFTGSADAQDIPAAAADQFFRRQHSSLKDAGGGFL